MVPLLCAFIWGLPEGYYLNGESDGADVWPVRWWASLSPGWPGTWGEVRAPCKWPLWITLSFAARKSILEVRCKPLLSFLVLAGIHMGKRQNEKFSGAPGCAGGVVAKLGSTGNPPHTHTHTKRWSQLPWLSTRVLCQARPPALGTQQDLRSWRGL